MKEIGDALELRWTCSALNRKEYEKETGWDLPGSLGERRS